jgi:hypothetical protein
VEDIVCGVVLLAEIVAVVFIVLVSRAPFRSIGKLFHRLRSKKGAPQDTSLALEAELNATPDLKGQLGVGAFASLRRAFRPYTETEEALARIDPGFPRDDGRTEGPHDFAGNEEKNLHRRGWLIRWIYVKPSYMSDIVQMTDEIVQIYYKAAQRFFSHQVRIGSDAKVAYEDDEGAIAVELFRVRDRNCYYLMNEMRRVINDNVRKLAFAATGILLAVFVAGVFLADFLNKHFFFVSRIAHDKLLLGRNGDWWDKELICLMLCAAGALGLWLLHRVEYVPYQRNNGNELRNFLSRYLSRLSDRYHASIAAARGVTMGVEKDGQKLSAEARKWHKVMLWLAFRSFFIESFLRSVLFQIVRNSSCYIVYVPIGFGALILGSMAVVAHCGGHNFIELLHAPGPIFYAGYAVLCLVVWRLLKGVLDPIDEFNQKDWLGFDNVNVDKGMDEVVGKYAEDVGYWKSRLDH